MTQSSLLRPLWGAALLYNFLVILFGAYVRISKSGDGCGQHWPTCHGQIAHMPKSLETVIELTHRVTSGLSLLLVIGLALATLRSHPRRHPARSAAVWAMVFIIVEALVGAAIVLLRLVGNDSSVARAVVMAVHLINTCLLTFSLLFATRTAGQNRLYDWRSPHAGKAWFGALLLLAVSAAGAVTALGDTLFPLEAEARVAQQALSASAHFLERTRGFHPVLATLSAGFLLWAAPSLGASTHAGARAARGAASRHWVVALVLVQMGLGLLNVWLSAPGWMQVVHLAAANVLWLAWSWLLLDTCEVQPTPQLG